jgi:hypothetical protein
MRRQAPGTGFSTLPPLRRAGGRWSLGSVVSALLHLAVLVLVLRPVTREMTERATTPPEASERPILLDFAPPRPVPTPRAETPAVDEPPPEVTAPLTPGPDETPGSSARVTETPEENPNAPPNAPRTEATRPDPNDAPDEATEAGTPPREAAAPAPGPLATADPALETEARRIFGRPSTRLGPTAGTRDNRPWETSTPQESNGCSLPPEDSLDTSLPPGMAAIEGRIFHEGTGRPLPGARLQILGTPYGTFANERGEYRLVFERKLVDRCRTQAVRVTAPGYQARDVILFIGNTPNGDVPLRRF